MSLLAFNHFLIKKLTFEFFFLLFWWASESHLVMSDSLQTNEPYSPWNSLGQNTEVALSLLQGIFPTQRSNPGLLHCKRILLPAEPQGKPLYFGSAGKWSHDWKKKKKIVMCTHSDLPFFLTLKFFILNIFKKSTSKKPWFSCFENWNFQKWGRRFECWNSSLLLTSASKNKNIGWGVQGSSLKDAYLFM